jgi:dephospho-CoA kinase
VTVPHQDDSSDTFVIVGLTGGIACGKTTVAGMLEELGAPVIDADDLAREVVQPGEPALDDIVETFGEKMLNDDGELDRDALGDRVFNDEEARQRLESITHPRIAQRMQKRATELRESGDDWVVYDAALIVENDLHHGLDSLIVVTASEQTQIDRLMERDDFSGQQARDRIDAQMPIDQKADVADYVIDNDGSLDDTHRQVEEVYHIIDRGIAMFGTADREKAHRQDPTTGRER